MSGYTLVTDVADLDDDGDADLVAGHSAGVSVFFSDGSTLATQVDYTGARVGAVELGDVDADGDIDLLGLDHNGDLNLWANDGRGSFSLVQALPTGAGEVLDSDWDSIDLVDLNLDGALDVLVLVYDAYYLGTDPLVAYLNNGGGQFDPTVWSSAATGIFHIDVGDIDDEGHADIVYQSVDYTLASIMWDGGFGAVTSWPTPAYDSFLIGDVDGDGDTDAVGAGMYTVGVMLQDGGTLVDQGVWYDVANDIDGGWASVLNAELVDMNGDGCAEDARYSTPCNANR
jgi:hypothetical protein